MKLTTIKFNDDQLDILLLNYYDNARQAIQVVNSMTDEAYCTITVNLPNMYIEDGHVFAKNYSENETIYNFLVNRGILIPTGRWVSSGFVNIPVCRIAENLKEYYE